MLRLFHKKHARFEWWDCGVEPWLDQTKVCKIGICDHHLIVVTKIVITMTPEGFLKHALHEFCFGNGLQFKLIKSPKQRLGDILFLLRFLLLLLHYPDCCRVIAILRFFFTIIIILIILPHIFVRSISRRCLDQTLWNLVGISYAMWSCTFKCWFFQNGCCCHGNGQNAKKLKKHKNDHSRLLAKQKLMKVDRNNIHI